MGLSCGMVTFCWIFDLPEPEVPCPIKNWKKIQAKIGIQRSWKALHIFGKMAHSNTKINGIERPWHFSHDDMLLFAPDSINQNLWVSEKISKVELGVTCTQVIYPARLARLLCSLPNYLLISGIFTAWNPMKQGESHNTQVNPANKIFWWEFVS